ncbi:hypothetical protein LIER_14474 [Lithospermum erythrorhizon]|uniref:RING-type domain-containing protein n=1 Tax=Lithospermum erythrorhizon TaxID=34254 RepID=A0AAV3PZA0_LITER
MEPGGGAEVQRTNSVNLRDLLRIDVERTNSAILLDFLRVKQEECFRNDIGRSSGNIRSRQSLGDVLSLTKNTISNDGSILDAKIDEPSGSGGGSFGGSIMGSKKNWRGLRKRLKLRGGDSIPAPDVPVSRRSHRISLSELLQTNSNQGLDGGSSILYDSVGNADEEVVEEGAGESSGGGEEPVRMSLMALIAEADSAYIINGNELEEEKEKEEEGEEETGNLLKYNGCCVCMVRHKGAAFIPCGHTFCRICSRKIYVKRGNCPICNNLILDILDIF